MSPSALISYSDAKRNTPVSKTATRVIREAIDEAFSDDEFFADISKYLQDPGAAGNRQMDQALVAEALFNYADILRSFDGLTHKKLWHHVSVVLGQMGYQFSGGRVTGHLLEFAPEPSTEVELEAV